MRDRRVGLCWSEEACAVGDAIPANEGRTSMVFQLITAYKLHRKYQLVTVKPATADELARFHSAEYVQFVLAQHAEDAAQEEPEEREIRRKFGLLYDCPVFTELPKYVKLTAGSTLSAARFVLGNHHCQAQVIAVNWFGGRHHAKKSRASGFCYVNDIVLGILELRKKYTRIMYIDFDLHHCDGVEDAFKFSDKVITFSIHRKEIGFFPGSGSLEDAGSGRGRNKSFNIPIKHGFSDSSFSTVVDEILLPVISKVNPDFLVLQCGLDGLSSDEHNEWNLSIKGVGCQVQKLLDLGINALVLGGGGYNHEQVARGWCYLTSIVAGEQKEFDLLPDEVVECPKFSPNEYEFWNVHEKNMVDENSAEYIDSVKSVVLGRV